MNELDTNIASVAGREWRGYVENLAKIGERVVPLMVDAQDPLLRQEMYQFLFQEISRAYVGLFYQDPAYPVFWPIQNLAFNVYGPNPDYIYNIAPVDGNGVYNISGFRGSVRFVDFQMGGGQLLTLGKGAQAPSAANYGLDELQIGKDGSFEVIVSQQRPDGYTGDWWKIFPDTTYVYMRQGAYDWINEEDARVVIERLDGPAIKPRRTAEQISELLNMIPGWAENWATLQVKMLEHDKAQGLINNVAVYGFEEEGGTHAQKYVKGQWDLQPDEALILQTDLPKKCSYWSFALHDLNYSTIDYAYRQSSLNGFQARLDSDGKFRAVICGVDPGVPNWLDTAGHHKGAILGRWRESDSAPRPEISKVKLSELSVHLPSDTPVVTPEMRDAAIRLRSKGVNLRRKW